VARTPSASEVVVHLKFEKLSDMCDITQTPDRQFHYRLKMATFFFYLLDGNHVTEDEEGQDLSDVEAAREEATESARELIADAARQGFDISRRRFRVSNSSRKPVFTLLFREALKAI
jgi:hypothetical protein